MQLYGFTARDCDRLHALLTAYEQGRIRLDVPAQWDLSSHQQDVFLAQTTASISAGELGTAYLVNLNASTPTPVQTVETSIPTIPVYNYLDSVLEQGTYLVARENSQGYYVPVDATAFLNANVSSVSITSSWANVTGFSVTLPAYSVWQLTAQITGDIASSASSTGSDFLSFRFYDGTSQWGVTGDCCYANCASITVYDAVTLVADVTVGSSALTVYVQGLINTSTSSTGNVRAGYLSAIQVQ